MHLLVDSTGLKPRGAGEWPLEKHGTRTRRSWKEPHPGVDAGTGQIVGRVHPAPPPPTSPDPVSLPSPPAAKPSGSRSALSPSEQD